MLVVLALLIKDYLLNYFYQSGTQDSRKRGCEHKQFEF